jgi:hypothetical protein
VISYDGEATINRPTSEVFAYATEPKNLPQWSDVSYVEMLTNGPIGLGSRLKITMGQGPMRATSDFEVSEWEQDRTWMYKTLPPHWLLWDATYRVEPLGPSSTRVTTHGDIRISGMRRILEPIIRRELSIGEQGELNKLKTILEDSGTTSE